MKVLFLGQPHNLEPWFGDVVRAVGEAHVVALYDESAPVHAQLQDVAVVIDQGGSVGSRAMVETAARAGVRLWQVLGTGMDNVDIDHILDQGLTLANTPGSFSSVALAEHALFLMLYFAKNFRESQDNMRRGVFYRPMNDELAGSPLGLVGLGASGQELASRARAFGMRISGIDVQPPAPEVLEPLGITYLGGPDSLHTLLKESDYVSVHVPLTRRTRHMIDARALAQMRPESVLIDVARGEIVDHEALVDALRKRSLRGAGIDVFAHEPLPPDDPLLALDNVVLTPHLAGVTYGTSRRRADAVAENVRRTAAGLPPLYAVSRPD
jgi:D-3-phosphoglycerate dehydrogenase / 2-oxoglutarate reductase